eukprot:Anaeramoba_flamelloidesa329336_65.p1 GENE.a329336_65~~a329336_65.p1  ORF type:complete len:231 (+),score=61.42 a329336_65:92-694(+)
MKNSEENETETETEYSSDSVKTNSSDENIEGYRNMVKDDQRAISNDAVDYKLFTRLIFPNLKYLTSMPNALNQFRSFLKLEFADENIDFWNEAEQYQSYKNGHEDQKYIAKRIYDKYISAKAGREINIEHGIKVEISDKIREGLIDRDLFVGAKNCIENLLLNDKFTRFLESKFAKQILQDKLKLLERIYNQEVLEVKDF